MTSARRDTFFAVLQKLAERIWLPHQSGLEFYDERSDVIAQCKTLYQEIPKRAQESASQFRKALDRYRQYRWIEIERWAEMLDKAADEISEKIAKQQPYLDGFEKDDPVERRLHELFDGKIGEPYADLYDVYLRAEQRIQLNIPPGYEDSAKKNFHRCGDVLVWFQLLQFALRRYVERVLRYERDG